jgi:hypothetical protein
LDSGVADDGHVEGDVMSGNYEFLGERPYGTAVGTCDNGAVYVRIHYTADPTKRDSEWIERSRREMGWKMWSVQMEMQEDTYDLPAVYTGYLDSFHCPQAYCFEPIPVVKNGAILCGWDAGETHHPAAVVMQVTPISKQFHVLREIIPTAPTPFIGFVEHVTRELKSMFPGDWDRIIHVGDPAMNRRSGLTGDTAVRMAKGYGITIDTHIPYQPVDIRINAVDRALIERVDDGAPKFILCGAACPVLRRGFQGRYCWDASGKRESPDSLVYRSPKKDLYSHPQDALQAAVLKAFMLEATKHERKRKTLGVLGGRGTW